jgi:hypothetical protein
VDRVNRVFLALKPIAWDFRKYNLTETILPCERFPIGNEWSRLRSQVSPDQSRPHTERIGLDPYFVFEARFRRSDIVERLFEATAVFVEEPPMVVAA